GKSVCEEGRGNPGITGEVLLQMLELRIDNVVYRANFAASRNQARQLVRHGHVTVNGQKVTIPSQQLRKGDVVEVQTKSRQMIVLRHNLDILDRAVPAWLDVSSADF